MIIRAENISKTNGVKKIVDSVSFTIEENDKLCIVGVNGIGKSTLLKIIAKLETYDQGNILYKKDLKINYLPQIPSFDPSKTILEEVKEKVAGKDTEEYKIHSILNKFGIRDFNQRIGELSGGQIKRIALAITLMKPADLLILDEPTNHLDNSMIEYLEKVLIKYNKAILMVTHDRYFLERIATKIIEIDRTQLYEYDANYSTFLENKQKREENSLAQQSKRKQFLKKELEWVRAGAQARSTKSKERLQRFEQLNAIEDIQEAKGVDLISNVTRLGKKTIELIQVSHQFSDKLLFHPFSYMFKRDDRIAIIGDNGVGKSTLLNIIAKTILPTSGEVIYGDTIKTAYFRQGTDSMDESMRVIDYIKEKSDAFESEGMSLNARQMCERFLFDSDAQYNTISRLSGGERRRLYLLRVLMENPNVLLLDEPTNDLDIGTLQIFEDYLDEFNGIVIMVSHDRFFIDRVCDKVFVLKDQTISILNGAYSDNYAFINNETVKQVKVEKPVKTDTKRKLSYQEKKELESMDSNILALEAQIKSLEEEMNQTQEYETIASLSKEVETLSTTLEEMNERYLELMEINEG